MALVERDDRTLQRAVEAGKFTYEEYKGPWNEDMKLLDPFGLLEYLFYTCKIEGDDREYICAVSELDSEDTKTMLTREILRQMVCKPISKGDKIADIDGMSFYYGGWNVHGWHVVYTKGVRNDFKVTKEKHILPTEMDCKEIYRIFYKRETYLGERVGYYDVEGEFHIEDGYFSAEKNPPSTNGVKEVIVEIEFEYQIKEQAIFRDGKFYRYGNEVKYVNWWRERQ